MSTGGKFLLQINTGLQDRLLNAHDILQKRINEFIVAKRPTYNEQDLAKLPKDGYLSIDKSVLPSLNIIEQTHNVFVNSTYKPYVSTTYEYLKISPYGGAVNFGNTLIYQPTQVGNFMNDMVLHVRIKGLKALDARDRVRYVAFPAHKLIQRVQFVISNGIIIDEYDMDDYNNYYLYELNSDEKRKKWCQNVGQELPKIGYLTSDPSIDMIREYKQIGDGFQTLKYSHDTLEMFIPLLFWCKDIRSAIPSHIIPWGQIQIKVQLANITEIVGFADYGGGGGYQEPQIEMCDLYINNIFTSDMIFQIYNQKFVFNLIRVHQHHKQTNLKNGSHSILLNNLKYPLETLFFCFKPRENLNISQLWYKTLKLTEQTFKVPVVAKNTTSTLVCDIVSVSADDNKTAIIYNTSLSAIDQFYVGYDFIITEGRGYNDTDIMLNRYIITSYEAATKKITVSPNWTGVKPDNTTKFELFTPQLAINTVSYYKETPTVSTIALRVNDIEVWREHSELFYNSYIPFRFGGDMGMPMDRGTYCIPFNLYPMNYQPTGSFNSSIGRELYLQYTSDVITEDYPVDLIVCARAINFLIVKNGSMVLKYIT